MNERMMTETERRTRQNIWKIEMKPKTRKILKRLKKRKSQMKPRMTTTKKMY